MKKIKCTFKNGSRQKITQIITHPNETAHKSGSHQKNKPEKLASYNAPFFIVVCVRSLLAFIHSRNKYLTSSFSFVL